MDAMVSIGNAPTGSCVKTLGSQLVGTILGALVSFKRKEGSRK
jgi:hypothetical protein